MELPANVTEIAGYTFFGCNALENLTALDHSHIASIGEFAFHGCSRLKRIDIGDSVVYVGSYAFAGCSALSSTPALNSLTELGDHVFADCTALSHVFIPERVFAIHQGAFYNCCSLQSIEWGIPLNWVSSTITIGKSAFRNCSSLRNLSIPAAVAWIEEYAFQDTGLDGATFFPRDGRIIDESAFPPLVVTACSPGFELSVHGCTCPEGTRFSARLGGCSPCEEYFECPGGHLEADPGVDDTSVTVKEGYMTLRSSPFSVYQCVQAQRCAGNRQVLANMCSGGFDSASARCAECLPDRYLSDGTCRLCSDVTVGFVMARYIVSGVAQLLFTIAFYIIVNSPSSDMRIAANQGMFELLVDFVQIIQTLSRLDIVVPPVLQSFFDFFGIFTIPGFIKKLSFKPECTFGPFGGSITFNILQETSTPLVLFANLAMMQVVFVMCGGTLRRDFVHNLICLVFANLFMSLVVLSLSLFYTERMPNGKDMVIAFPQLEYGSPSWMLYLPINLFATCLYGLTTYSYVVYAVLTAPRRVGTEPGFLARYRFCFGTKRPDRWWWIMVKMSLGLSLCLVQVVLPADNLHSHVYTSALLMILVSVVIYGSWPWKFDSNNWVDYVCKIALLILLMLTTSFIDTDSVTKSERNQTNNIWAHLAVFTLTSAFAFALALFMRDVASSMKSVRIKRVKTARAMWHLRDMSLALLMMPEEEYARRLAAIGDTDRALILGVTKTIKNVMFGQQESSGWMRQRLIAGRELEVWDHGRRVLGFLRESRSGRLRERLDQSMRFRMCVLKLAKAIPQSESTSSLLVSSRGSIDHRHSAIRGVLQMRRLGSDLEDNRRSDQDPLQSSTRSFQQKIQSIRRKVFTEPEMTRDRFIDTISRMVDLSMPEDEIDMLFSVLDSNGSGTVTHQKLTDLLSALAADDVLAAVAGGDEDGDVLELHGHAAIVGPPSVKQENEDELVAGEAPSTTATGSMALQERNVGQGERAASMGAATAAQNVDEDPVEL
ncbi:unnamed protein product [Prorocentrum cordatum]|uniref:EF-hand domain-containing protein n=1 Tax=Prorocentrum cordatum TaxID=2364126 RepID=A0ABN9UZN6_9DINO|nr:unnamed protein product [Polarella glacialis]